MQVITRKNYPYSFYLKCITDMRTFVLYIFTLLEFIDSFIFVKSLITFIYPFSATNISSLAMS